MELMKPKAAAQAEPRVTLDQLHMGMAWSIADRSTCPINVAGAILVFEHQIVASGYVGTAAGEKHCDELHGKDTTMCVWAMHAETNALIYAAHAGRSTLGATMFSTEAPCGLCAGLLINAGVVRVVFDREPPNQHHGLGRLGAGGILVEQLSFSSTLDS